MTFMCPPRAHAHTIKMFLELACDKLALSLSHAQTYTGDEGRVLCLLITSRSVESGENILLSRYFDGSSPAAQVCGYAHAHKRANVKRL